MNDVIDDKYTEQHRLAMASGWLARVTEAGGTRNEEFQAWLRSDARNEAAWRQVCGMWNLLGEHATAPEVLALRQAALADVHRAGERRWTKVSSRRRILRISAVAAALMVAIAALLLLNFPSADIYQTAAGERRVVPLADGSQLQLDAQTEVRVRYTRSSRELTLVRGQVQFAVAHGVPQPFSVTAGSRKVIATGTAFNINLLQRSVSVTLIEGRVIVLPRDAGSADSTGGPGMGVALNPGEQLVSEAGQDRVVPVDVEQMTAWRRGLLVFDNQTLAAVVEQMNRYSVQPITVDEEVANVRFSGVLRTDDPSRFIRTITSYLPVADVKAPDGTRKLVDPEISDLPSRAGMTRD